MVLSLSLLNADGLFDFSEWKTYDRNILQKPKGLTQESIDFQSALSSSLAKILERGNSADTTESHIDYAQQNLQIRNINLIYENEKNSLFLQKELFINKDYVDYSNGLISRYQRGDLLLGLNGFADKQQEEKIYSFGTEFGLSRFFKAYTNYYIFEEEKNDDMEFGLVFALPQYTPLGFDLSADYEKVNYTINYSPYSFFNVALTRQQYKDIDEPRTNVYFGFKLNYNESFLKQLRKGNNQLQRINRYDFFNRKRFF